MNVIPRIVIAAPSSGAGKTTIATGLMAALSKTMNVQGFKVGPDYIDPTYHTLATGRPARNLDSWMMPDDTLLQSFSWAAAADIAVIEGVMGLFDGAGAGERGSTAEIAKRLGVPVIVVLDARAMSRSAGAIALGMRDFDPAVNVVGVICNRVGSERHAAWVRAAVESVGLPVLGCVPRHADIQVPERHLGLHLAAEQHQFIEKAGTWIEQHVDMNVVFKLANQALPLESVSLPIPAQPAHVRIAVAQDSAFAFYYADNFELLRQAGAELVSFSPVAGDALPANVSGVYLGGGYPELHAAAITANKRLREQLQAGADSGMPIYAECGGLMALAETLIDGDGVAHPMLGLLPGTVRVSIYVFHTPKPIEMSATPFHQ
ncbi:MAG: cobyrinate a,c-diamide synthase [Chloroflexota bacterium]